MPYSRGVDLPPKPAPRCLVAVVVAPPLVVAFVAGLLVDASRARYGDRIPRFVTALARGPVDLLTQGSFRDDFMVLGSDHERISAELAAARVR